MNNPRRIAFAGLAALSALAMSSPAVAGDGTSYVLFTPGSESVSMSGSTDDIRRARALRAGDEALLYVRRGGAAYVIRDPATLRAARALFQPQEAVGAQQAELGSRQAALGARQAELGAEQARLGARQADATPREAAALAAQQAELGRRQGELGDHQGALGEQQGALGREQARLARIANEKLQALLADAIRRGLAQRVD
ncbi:MAG: hypothetical protein ACM3ZV_02255 [Bacillota bacterium]